MQPGWRWAKRKAKTASISEVLWEQTGESAPCQWSLNSQVGRIFFVLQELSCLIQLSQPCRTSTSTLALIKVSHIAFIENAMLMTGCLTPTNSQWMLCAHIAHGMQSPPLLSQAPIHQQSLLMLADKMNQLFLVHMQLWTKAGIPGILCNSIFGIMQLLVLHFSIGFSCGFILGKIYHIWAIMPQKGSLCHYEATSTALTE